MKLPEKYLNNMKKLLKDDYQDYLACFDHPSFNGLRINTSKISVEDFITISPFDIKPVPWCDNGFIYNNEDKPSGHPYYHAGLYYLQEPSAMAPASIMDIEENDYVLDLCSAPGGKATQLANKLNGTGILVSNDISASRQNATLRNLERFGVTNSFVISDEPSHLAEKWPEAFDKILVDAPCSGEGMFRKDPSLIKSWLERGNEYYCEIQKSILENAVKMLKPGGKILYSTCTFSPKENEEVMQYILDKHSEFTLLPINQPLFEHGVIKNLEYCARLYPHKLHGEGHFLVLLQKNGTSNKQSKKKYPFTCSVESVNEFMKQVKKDFSGYEVKIMKDKVLFVPDTELSFDSVRVLRSGLLAGVLKKDNFEPCQQLAMALKADEFNNVISLDVNDERVNRYLKGETIEYECSYNGWVLICVDKYPLGFGKIKNNRIKNKIDSGWRKL